MGANRNRFRRMLRIRLGLGLARLTFFVLPAPPLAPATIRASLILTPVKDNDACQCILSAVEPRPSTTE
jgi:hypothetical protein